MHLTQFVEIQALSIQILLFLDQLDNSGAWILNVQVTS